MALDSSWFRIENNDALDNNLMASVKQLKNFDKEMTRMKFTSAIFVPRFNISFSSCVRKFIFPTVFTRHTNATSDHDKHGKKHQTNKHTGR